VANVGLIVAREGVIVIGTGANDSDAQRLLRAIARLTAKPVVLAINTYAGPEHVLGNAAFARLGIPILAHRETDNFMVYNCATCIRNQKAETGDAQLQEDAFARPSRLIDGPTRLAIGGRDIEIMHFGWTHQPGDIAVFDHASGVLFAGAMVSLDVLPDAHTADADAWIGALERLQALPMKTVVPARGPVSPKTRIAEVIQYLRELREATRAAYAKGIGIREAAQSVTTPRYSRWAMYDTLQRRNVHHLYLKLEVRELAN
jgi:glyoxylase-like metal-dependent hydrolase (beta-lactamase superfamily II)